MNSNMEQIGFSCKHKIPKWIHHAERRFRKKYHGYKSHGIPVNTSKHFIGKRYIYLVVYGDVGDFHGEYPTITYYRKRKYNIIKRIIMVIQGKRVY